MKINITNLGYDMLVGEEDVQPTKSIGGIKSVPAIEYKANTQTIRVVNGDGYTQTVVLDKEGQEVIIEIWMNEEGFNKINDAFHNGSVISLAQKYPKGTETGLKDYWYNGVVTGIKKSDITDPEVAFFSFGFKPTGAPHEWVEPTGE